jgi:cell division protein FtsB
VLASVAQDLAVARRENAALKRENRQLRARVTMLNKTSADPILEAAWVAKGACQLRPGL